MRVLRALGAVACGLLLFCTIFICNARVCFEGGKDYTFFCGTSSSNCRIVAVDGNAALKKLTLADVRGESATYDSLDIAQFLEDVDGEIVFTEKLSDSVNYYCKADLPYSAELYGVSINLHICVKEDGVKVASPIIFGGY